MGVLVKATGLISIYEDAVKMKEAYKKGDTGVAIWEGVKGMATAGFLIFGGEEIELGWNLGTLLVDKILGD